MCACMHDRPDQTRPDRHTQIWPVFIFPFQGPSATVEAIGPTVFQSSLPKARCGDGREAPGETGAGTPVPFSEKTVQPYWWRTLLMLYPAKCFALLDYNRSRKVGHRWFSAGMRFFSTKRMAESAFFDTATAERHRICCIRYIQIYLLKWFVISTYERFRVQSHGWIDWLINWYKDIMFM